MKNTLYQERVLKIGFNKITIKSQKKIVDYIFIALCTLSITLPFLWFVKTNNPQKIDITNFGEEKNGIYSIDACKIESNVLFVRGWAAPVDGINKINNNNKVYLITSNGLVLIKTSIVNRVDVSTHYNKPGLYDFSGFSGSINMFFNKQNDISLLIIADNGSQKGSVRYACK